MSAKKKIFILILGIEALAIAGLIVFLFYLNSDTVKINHQLELAQHYLLEQDYEQAIAVFNTVIEIDPKNVDAYVGLAQAYAESGNLEEAVKTLEKGYKETDAEEIKELKVAQTENLAQIEMQKEEETIVTADMESQIEGSGITTTDTTLPENMLQPEEISPIQTGFATQEGELYYYDEQSNMVTGWFEVNSKRYCAKSDGKLYKGGQYEVDGINYLFGQDGLCLGEMKDEHWKQAYYDYIVNEAGYQNGEYALCFVDDNEIPELLYIQQDISGTRLSDAACIWHLITYKDGAVYTYEDAGGFTYIPRSGLVYSGDSRFGYSWGKILRLNNAAWQQVAEFEYYFEAGEDNSEHDYKFNGQEVTEEQYNENLDTLFDFNQAIVWWDIQTMNPSSMLVYLQN